MTTGIITGYHVADLVVDVSARPQGDFKDWPRNIQDGIYQAIEKHEQRILLSTGEKRSYEIARAWSEDGIDGDKPFVHVVIRAPKYYKGVIQ